MWSSFTPSATRCIYKCSETIQINIYVYVYTYIYIYMYMYIYMYILTAQQCRSDGPTLRWGKKTRPQNKHKRRKEKGNNTTRQIHMQSPLPDSTRHCLLQNTREPSALKSRSLPLHTKKNIQHRKKEGG